MADVWLNPLKDALARLGLSTLPGGKQKMAAARAQVAAAARAGGWAESAVLYRQHLNAYPGDFRAWVQLGHSLKEAGRHDEADAAYGRAARIRPRDPDLLLNRGHLAKMAGQHEAAHRYYLHSFTLDGNALAGGELRSLSGPAFTATPNTGARISGSIDRMVGSTLQGWAVNPSDPSEPAQIEVFQQGRLVGSATCTVRRADVAAAGFGAEIAGFRAELSKAFSRDNGDLTVRLQGTGLELSNSPFPPPEDSHIDQWLERAAHLTDSDRSALRRRLDAETQGQILSILMPVYNTPDAWLREALDSVRAQYCSHWELICVDDRSTAPHVAATLAEYAALDARIRVVTARENGGIARSTNLALTAATGDYVALMDHDDYLEPEAVYRLLDAARTGAELIYTDEVIIGSGLDSILQFVCRPAFSPDYYASHPYFVHIVCVRRDVALDAGGFDVGMAISADVDFVLRVIERAALVVHVPVVLYRWRTHEQSAGHQMAGAVMAATGEALGRHFARLGRAVTVTDGPTFNTYKITPSQPDGGRTLVVIPTKNRVDLLEACIASVRRTTDRTQVDILVVDHQSDDPETVAYLEAIRDDVRIEPYSGVFNYSKMNNDSAFRHAAAYDYVLFLNNDVAAIEAGWLEHMRGLCARPDVGVVGAMLLYADETVQHAGVVLGVGGPAEHAHKFEPLMTGDVRNPGYNGSLVSVREYSAVTGACMMMRSDVFMGVGGFDEDLAVGFNDIDLCLRIGSLGLKILYDGHAVLHHYESATRARSKQIAHPEDTARMRARWRAQLAAADPFYNPAFGIEGAADHVVSQLDHPYASVRARRLAPVLGDYAMARPRRIPPVQA